jgi:hypothetical protein
MDGLLIKVIRLRLPQTAFPESVAAATTKRNCRHPGKHEVAHEKFQQAAAECSVDGVQRSANAKTLLDIDDVPVSRAASV